MQRASKILVGITLFLIVLSVSATFYKTVILQDFEMTGAYIEFPTENSSYVWFVYNNEEYEFEFETSSFDEILALVAAELGVAVTDLEPDFLEYLQTAYDQGEVTNTGAIEGNEETSEEELFNAEPTEGGDMTEATSTEAFTEAELTEQEI